MTVICLVRRRPQALQDLCFEMIAKNFSTILSISTEKNIDFLRRKSELLLMKFQELERSVCMEHAFFCLNRYLKEIHFSWFTNVDIPAIVKKLATVESTFTVLTFERFSISLDVLWLLVCSLPMTLESLSLYCVNCTDNMLEIVRKRCPRLRELSLSTCCNISDVGVMALCPKNEIGDLCPNQILQKLDLLHTKVTENGLVFVIKNFTNLIEIRHDMLINALCKIYSENLNNRLTKKCNLKSLCYKPDVPPMCNLKPIPILFPYVTKLWIRVHNQNMLKMCEEFTLLNDVHFTVDKLFDFTPFFEVRGKTLKAVNIHHVQPSEDSAYTAISLTTVVKSCPRLEYLFLWRVTFTEVKSESNLRYTLPHLTEVVICVKNLENLEEALICLLSKSPNLEKFIFENSSSFHPAPNVFSFFKYISLSRLNKLVMRRVDVNISTLLDTMCNFKCVRNDFF